ncbi:MAG: phage major capsid protein [Acetobacteraceae bacterium]
MPPDLVTLRQNRDAALRALDAAAAAPSDSADYQANFDAAADRVEAVNQEIANAERLQQLRGNRAVGGVDPTNPASDPSRSFMARYRSLPAAYHTILPGHTLSMAQTAAFGDLLVAVMRAKTGRGVDERLMEASLGANEAIPSDGGFLVEKDIADGLLTRSFQLSRIGSRVRRIPISGTSNGLKINALADDSRATGSRWGGIRGFWIPEGGSLTPSRPKMRSMNLELKKLGALMYCTSEQLQDAPAVAAIMSQAFPEEFAFLIDDAIFEGPGSDQPLGFMNAGGKVTVPKEAGQASKTIQYENITNMWARLPAGSMATAEWWINSDAMPALQSMSMVIGTGGVPVYMPPGGLSQSPYGSLFGRPVIPLEYCNTLGTEGDIVLADPTKYVMIDKGDIQYATSIHVAFLTDEQAFRFIYRVDGQPVDDKPITPFKGTNKQSTFITLQTR